MRRIQCSEIRGGIHDRSERLCSPGLTAALYTHACDGGKGGDVHYFSVCDSDMLTRIAVADVMGHGPTVSGVSREVYDTLKTYMNDPNGGELLGELNRRLVDRYGLDAMTTAAILAYYTGSGRLSFAYAGHPPVLVRRRVDPGWFPVELAEPAVEPRNLPLSVKRGARFDQQEIKLSPGDRFFVYTDGVLEAADAKGEPFGRDRLIRLLDAHARDDEPADLTAAVLAALRDHSGGALDQDDVTLISLAVR